jgi:hypothetical protein
MPAPTAAIVFDDYNTSGVPSSGAKKVKKSEARAWGAWLEMFVSAAGSNGGSVYATAADLLADLSPPANAMAWVVSDPVVFYNAIYQKVGNSGVGHWARAGDLPYSFAIASDAGAGTANAIQITTDIPVSDGVIVTFVLFENTTSAPVTISVNGGTPLTLKTNRGNNASALTGGMDIWFRVRSSDNTARMLNDQDVSALVDAAADEFVAATQVYRDQAAASASASAASATDAQMYADMIGAAVFDFNVDSAPSTPGYDWNT